MAKCWFIYWDACGLACFSLGILTVLLVDYVTVFHVIGPWFLHQLSGRIHAIVFQFVCGCIILSYIKAASTDPGSVEKNTATEADIVPPMTPEERRINLKLKRRYCTKCKCIKPPRAHHCSTCHRCINKMDHHCPWVNNCVGSNNMKFFLLFLFWTFIGSSYAATMAIWRAYVCYKTRCPIPATPIMVMCVFSTIMAIFFAIFVVAMMWDQVTGMTTNTTGIEAMKGWDETPRSLGEGLIDACGEKCTWRWFLPIAMPKDSPSFYQWSKKDDPDAYDDRDPIVQRHMERVKQLAVHYDAKRLLGEDISNDEDQQGYYDTVRGRHPHEHADGDESSGEEDDDDDDDTEEEEGTDNASEDDNEDEDTGSSSESSEDLPVKRKSVSKPVPSTVTTTSSKLSMKSDNNTNNQRNNNNNNGNRSVQLNQDGIRKRNK